MQINATVNSAVPVDVPTEVQHEGQTIMAKVPMLDVELVTDDAGQKNPCFFAPADHAEMFTPGARVTITIAPLAPAGKDSK